MTTPQEAIEQARKALESCRSHKVYVGNQVADSEQWHNESAVNEALKHLPVFEKLVEGRE